MNTKLSLTMIIAMAVSCAVYGQQYMSQEGRMLDANNRIGSFGLNASVPTNTLAPRINNYITGNVTGGARFQGLVPYSSPYEINATLGSSTLSNFRRDSVGVGNVRQQRFQSPQMYVDTSRSVSGSYGNYIGQSASAGMTMPQSQFSSGSSLNQELASRPLATTAYSPLTTRSYEIEDNSMSLFGPAGDLSKRFQPWMLGTQAVEPLPLQRQDQEESQEGAPWTYVRPLAGQAVETKEPTVATPFEQQSSELQGMLAERAAAETAQPSSQDQMKDETAGDVKDMDARLYSDPKRSKESQAANQQHYEYYMQGAYACIAGGQYYEAIDAFAAAIIYKPGDARAIMGKAYALFAAGEFMSSAYYLEQALSLEPSLSRQRAGIDTLFNTPDDLQKRLDDLDRWQNRSDNPSLMFLNGYLRFAMNEDALAKPLLEKVIEAQPDNRAAKLLLEAMEEAGQGAAQTETEQ